MIMLIQTVIIIIVAMNNCYGCFWIVFDFIVMVGTFYVFM